MHTCPNIEQYNLSTIHNQEGYKDSLKRKTFKYQRSYTHIGVATGLSHPDYPGYLGYFLSGLKWIC